MNLLYKIDFLRTYQVGQAYSPIVFEKRDDGGECPLCKLTSLKIKRGLDAVFIALL